MGGADQSGALVAEVRGVAGARYTWDWVPARWYLAQLPQGRKAARVSELCQVRGGPFTSAAGCPQALGAMSE